jgi:glycosyltransferase involved in cell wall biosynthesis
MKFLHIGNNICGIPNTFKRAEIKAGHDAKTLSFVPDHQGHLSDYNYNEPSRFRRFTILLSLASSYEIFIFTGDSLIWGLDILLWKLLGKKVAIHYHGSEVRGKGPRFFHRFADALFVSTPDLLKDVPGAVWIPNPIFTEDYKQHYSSGVIIAHAPTDRELKGTQYLIDAFEEIHKQFPTTTLDLIEGVPYKEALERYRKSTLLVDSLVMGIYGMVALECMAMRVPVMGYIGDCTKDKIITSGFLPIWYTTKETLKQDIITVLSTPKSIMQQQVEEGHEYVRLVHNPQRCVELIVKALGG